MKVAYSIIAILILCGSCKPTPDCSEWVTQEHSNSPEDSIKRKAVSEYRDWLLTKFNETPAQSADIPTYHFMYYHAFEYGKSIKFENLSADNYQLTVKCIQDTNSLPKCRNYQIKIHSGDWYELMQLLDEYDFWTEEPFRRYEALDGYSVTLEGTRASVKNCDAKTYQFLGRISPRHDKIGSLFQEILFFESSFDTMYYEEEF